MLRENPIQQGHDVLLDIKVSTQASQSVIIGWKNGLLHVRLKAIAERGKANTCLIELLADKLTIAKSQIELISGHTARHKRVRLHNYNVDTLRKHI